MSREKRSGRISARVSDQKNDTKILQNFASIGMTYWCISFANGNDMYEIRRGARSLRAASERLQQKIHRPGGQFKTRQDRVYRFDLRGADLYRVREGIFQR